MELLKQLMYIDIVQNQATVNVCKGKRKTNKFTSHLIFLFSFLFSRLIIGLSKCFAFINENVFGFQKSSILHQGLDSANILSYVSG